MIAEPLETEENILPCQFRLPNGTTLKRRFYRSQKIKELYDFIKVQNNVGFEEEEDRTNFVF